jgi:hypothetical protein
MPGEPWSTAYAPGGVTGDSNVKVLEGLRSQKSV